MPTYQYSCNDCGHFFETFQSFTDDSLTVCPECEGRLRKVFNAVGVVFKGSGFYRNDSRSQKSGAEAGSSTTKESSGKESSGKESSGKGADKGGSDSKPAATSESSSGKSSGSSSTSPAAAPA